ncbi:MAG: hypothetical protein OYG31_01385 [Candidatus Kaiserbacteria bacterium]|nr:hypothetical protein [Candidatus Kaiserbacteria bacterium]
MEMIERIIAQPKHHAYIILGDVPEKICSGSEHLYTLCSEKPIGVDDIRSLSEYATQSVGADTRKVVVRVPGVTHQAQNALLKVLEEMRRNVHFFLCMPLGTDLLETLCSRCFVVEVGQSVDGVSETFQTFLQSSVKDRLALIDTVWEEGEGVRHIKILGLLQNLEQHLHQMIIDGRQSEVQRARKAADHLRAGIQGGALHKATVQTLAFV